MKEFTSVSQVLCRPAMASDRADVTEFCKNIWEGDDYVPEVWDEWFRDPQGLLAVAEYNGHAVGCSKVTKISKGQWWLEGFRVDPRYQGHKVGTQIHRHVTDWWLENGEGTIRLMTDAGNFAVHHLCQKTGYTKTGEVCGYKAAPLHGPTGLLTPVSDLADAALFAMASESVKTSGGLVDLGWRICRPEREIFESYANQDPEYTQDFYWWKDRRGLFSAWEEEDTEKKTLFLGLVACPLSDMPGLLNDIRRFAASKKCDTVFQIAFDIPQITSRLLAGGLEKKWKRSNAFVFERVHPGRL